MRPKKKASECPADGPSGGHWLKDSVSQISAIASAAMTMLVAGSALAAPEADAAATPAAADETMFVVYWAIAFVGAIIALIFAWRFFKSVMAADEGTEEMVEIAQHVRVGADAYFGSSTKSWPCSSW